MLFDEINSRHGGASGCQHGIGDNDGALLNGAWKLAVILMRLMGYLVAVKADMADLCAGNQGQNAVYHAKASAQDGNYSQLASGDHRRHAGL